MVPKSIYVTEEKKWIPYFTVEQTIEIAKRYAADVYSVPEKIAVRNSGAWEARFGRWRDEYGA